MPLEPYAAKSKGTRGWVPQRDLYIEVYIQHGDLSSQNILWHSISLGRQVGSYVQGCNCMSYNNPGAYDCAVPAQIQSGGEGLSFEEKDFPLG